MRTPHNMQCFALASSRESPLTVFVNKLSLECTAEDLRALFKLNEIVPPPLYIHFITDEATYKCAVCLLATPELCRKAISMGELAGWRVPLPTIQEHTKPDYYLSLLQCEMLMDHHFPLQWSSKVDFNPLPMREGSKLKARISVSIFWNRDAQERTSSRREPISVVFHTSQFEQQCDMDDAIGLVSEIKRQIAIAKSQAMSKVEVLILGGSKPIMRQAKTVAVVLNL